MRYDPSYRPYTTRHSIITNHQVDISLYKALFSGRQDCYGRIDVNSRGLSVKKPLADAVFQAHLMGKERVGIYPLVGDKCKFAVIDIDQDDLSLALAVVNRLAHYAISGYLERSKSKGYHIWVFFADWVLAFKIRAVLKLVLDDVGRKPEIFPKQDSAQNGFGNFIYLPLFNLKTHNGRTVFLDDQGVPYPDQLAFLQIIQPVPERTLDEVIDLNGLNERTVREAESSDDGGKTYIFVNEPISAILSNCEYLEGLRWKVKEEQHLEHAKRIYFANVFLPLG